MNYRTLWAYLRFTERENNYVAMPQIILDACVGYGEGTKLLSETEGEMLELLVSGEQGAITIDNVNDLKKFSCQELDSIKDTLRNLQNKGYVRFLDNFFL